MDQEIEKISKKLMKELDEDRYRHTQGVMYTSAALAMRYGADLKRLYLPDFYMIAQNAFQDIQR